MTQLIDPSSDADNCLPLHTLTIHAAVIGDMPAITDKLAQDIEARINTLPLNNARIACETIETNLDWSGEEALNWARRANPHVLTETLRLTIEAIEHNDLACRVTMQVLQQLLPTPTLSFSALHNIVCKQHTLQQRALHLHNLASCIERAGRERHIALPAYTPHTELLALCSHGAIDQDEDGSTWCERTDLGIEQAADAIRGIDKALLQPYLQQSGRDDDQRPPLILQLMATFEARHTCNFLSALYPPTAPVTDTA